MALLQEDIEQIQGIVKKIIAEAPETLNANVRYELDLRERTIRVEEELKHQRELMISGFNQMEKRFEQVDKRFEQVDKRFEQMHEDMNKRFEQVDKRFEQVDKRLEQVDKQLDQQYKEIMSIHQEIKIQMRWSFGALLGIGGLVVAVLKLAV